MSCGAGAHAVQSGPLKIDVLVCTPLRLVSLVQVQSMCTGDVSNV